MAIYADFEWSEVGQRIRARRLAQKKTQQQLAREAGLTQNAIFRLEVGNTNPQIDTLRTVAKVLETDVRELVCGVTDTDPRLGERLAAVRSILESGDAAAIRAMDNGLESAQIVLDRTSGFWEKEPALIRMGGRAYRRSVSASGMPLKEDGVRPSPISRTGPVATLPRRQPKKSNSLGKEIQAMTGYRIDDAPNLPVGNARKVALPKSNRHEEQYADSSIIAPRADSQGPRR
jgi:transcriptional regulator with XRE-family HTH domain